MGAFFKNKKVTLRRKMRTKRLHILAIASAVALLTGCGTGVEMKKAVTDRDVRRVAQQRERHGSSLRPFRDSVPAWQAGKRFFVTDDNARHLFAHSMAFDKDTMRLAGRTLVYRDYRVSTSVDNVPVVSLVFSAGDCELVYPTNKPLADFTSSFTIPLLIDLDMVAHFAAQLTGNHYFITTPLWCDPVTGEMKHGRKFVEVAIDSVLPGNKSLPLKVVFTAVGTGERGFVWMAGDNEVMYNRDFDSNFVATDPRKNYPHIAQDVWQHIVDGTVADGMTKEECRLSMGPPREVSRRPSQSGLRELWLYDGGTVLTFDDGVLRLKP